MGKSEENRPFPCVFEEKCSFLDILKSKVVVCQWPLNKLKASELASNTAANNSSPIEDCNNTGISHV